MAETACLARLHRQGKWSMGGGGTAAENGMALHGHDPYACLYVAVVGPECRVGIVRLEPELRVTALLNRKAQ